MFRSYFDEVLCIISYLSDPLKCYIRLRVSKKNVFVFQLWDLEANKKMADCSGHLSWVHRVQFSPDGSQLLSCSDDQMIRVRLIQFA